MKTLKILFSILFLIFIFAVLLITALYIFINPNSFKPIIVAQVKKQTGYELQIEGNLTWAFYPRLAIEVAHMNLTMPNQIQAFVDLRNVKIATPLSQLLQDRKKLEGIINVGEVSLHNLHVQNVSAELHWNDHILTLAPIKAALYGGSLTATASATDLSTHPRWTCDAKFTQVQLKPLLLDLNGPDSKLQISGTGDVKIEASTQGITRKEILNQMNGTGEISMKDGVVEGIDLNYFVRAANALLNKEPVPSPAATRQTAFDSLTSSFKINNGIASTNNLLLTSPAFITKGEGNIALVSQALDFKLQVNPKEAVKIPWEIPVLISGELSQPKIRLDTSAVEEFIAKQKLEKIKTKAVEEIKKHIHGKTGEFLQKLLGT